MYDTMTLVDSNKVRAYNTDLLLFLLV